jgi:D-methionine transport system permease protein
LGNFAIAYGYQKFDPTVTWTAVVIMIVLVQVVQGIANAFAKRLLRRQHS